MDLSLIFQYALIGAMLSQIDAIVDRGKRGGEFAAILLSVVCALLIVRLTVQDPSSALIFAGIILGVVIGGKVDALPYLIGAVIAGGGLLYALLYRNFMMLLPLSISLAFAGFVDEYGHDRIPQIRDHLMKWFFAKRFTLKFAVFFVAYLGLVSFSHFIAFLAFDIAYELNSGRKD
ncbi:MAG: hypothetical protein ABH863_02505 [Candidatus Micrarchaeota archaeon]